MIFLGTGFENTDASLLRDLAIIAAAVVAFAASIVGLMVGIKKLRETPLPTMDELKKLASKAKSDGPPQPLVVRAEVEYVKQPDFKDFEDYVHDAHHKLRNELQAIQSSADHRDQALAALEERSQGLSTQITTLSSRMDTGFLESAKKNSQAVGTLHGQLKTAEIKLAAVEADGKTNAHKLDQIDAKLDRLIERAGRKLP